MSKKIDLMEAAAKVILEKGVNKLTLDAVAKAASVSKGGLLYHYGTKDKLIKAMNVYVIEGFRSVIEKHARNKHTYHEAYLLATLDSLEEETALFDITPSLLAAIATNREVLDLWREEYQLLNNQLSAENYPLEYTLLVKSVCDGLWFSKLFNFGHMDHIDEQTVITYLLDLLRREEV